MKKTSICVLLILLIASVPLLAQSGGGGGMILGYQTSSYPFLEQYPVASNSLDLIYYGGFGYGVSYDGAIAGGFGMAIMDVTGGSKIAGGVGGFMAGIRLLSRPINLSLISWTGLGGLSTGILPADGHGGLMVFFEEVTLDIGLPIVRWFMPTIFVGYQLAGNLIPGAPFNAFLSYTPVIGMRIQWGKFY